MELSLDKPIGLIADSHGKNILLAKAISTLENMGANTTIHLGDICDSLHPQALEETVKILEKHCIRGVLGNNEYSIISDHHNDHVKNVTKETVAYLTALPYFFTLGAYCFTHSAPFAWPAATRRPISEFLPHLIINPPIDFNILFRGHSHRPSIIEISDGRTKKIPATAGKRQKLSRNSHYVITVGAVEEAASALFLPEEYEILFFTIDRE